MIGSGHAKEILDVMSQDQTPLEGTIKVSDMISVDTTIRDDGSVIGTINYISKYPEFSNNPDEQKGNFFPIKLDAKYAGKPITVKRNDGETTKTEQDLEWILRLASKDATYTFEADGAQIIKLNFKKATVKTDHGADAVTVAAQGDDMDSVNPASLLIADNVTIDWTDNLGKVKGNVHWYKFTNGHFAKKPTGHYVPVILHGHDGEEITATGSDGTSSKLVDPKWIIRVDDFIPGSKKATLAANGSTFAELQFNDTVLELPTGENAIDATKEDYGNFGKTADFYDGTLTYQWAGTKCTVSGKLKKVEPSKYEKLPNGGYFFAFKLIDSEFAEKQITVQLANTKTTDATDWVMTITEDSKKKPLIVKVGEQLIAEFDLNGLELVQS